MTTYQPGSHFGNYRIRRLLGQGGMADVYEAEDMELGRVVALKVLPEVFARDRERAGRFRREIETSAQLDHPHIVSIHDIGSIENLHYYTMALLPGGDLRAMLSHGALDPAEAVAIAVQIADALGYAHRRGVIHRDIKPENILFDAHGNAVLTDFGIARLANSDTRMTGTGMAIGTSHYMSPEQVRGAGVDARSDFYSLGVVVFEMLSGRVPFDATDDYAVGYQHLHAEVPRLAPGLVPFQKPVDALLAKRPRKRPGSAAAVQRLLRDALSGMDARAGAEGAVSGKEGRSASRRSLYWALGGVVAALMVVGGLAVVEQQTRPAVPIGGGGGSMRPSVALPPTAPVDASTPVRHTARVTRVSPPQIPPAFAGDRHADPQIRASMSRLSAFTQTSAVFWLPVVASLEEMSELLARASSSSITRHLIEGTALESHIEALRVLSSDTNRALATLDEIPRDLLELETELARYHADPGAANSEALRKSIQETLTQGERIDAALVVIERSLSDMLRRVRVIVGRGTRGVLGEALFRSVADSERKLAEGIEQVRDDRDALHTYLSDVRALQGWLRATTNESMEEHR